MSLTTNSTRQPSFLPSISGGHSQQVTHFSSNEEATTKTKKSQPSTHQTFSYLNTTDNDPNLRASSGTPATICEDLAPSPDITIYCQMCQCFIDLRALREHRIYHKSLDVLKYKGQVRPESVNKLMLRRHNILRRLKAQTDSEHPLDPKELQKVNDAYEFLKADLEDTFEAYRQIREETHTDVKGIALNCSADCLYAVAICSDGNERWKNTMEDTRVFQDCFGNDPHKCFFAIYDGHHGRFAAEMAASELHRALLLEMVKFDPRTKCTCTFNMVDPVEEESDAYCEIHSRSPSKITMRGEIHEESSALIQKIIQDCEERLKELEYQESAGDKSARKKKKVPTATLR